MDEEQKARMFVSAHVRALYKYPIIVGEEDLIKKLLEEGVSKDVIAKVLTDRTGDALTYDPDIQIGAKMETRLRGLLPPKIGHGYIPPSASSGIKKSPDTFSYSRYLVYSYCKL